MGLFRRLTIRDPRTGDPYLTRWSLVRRDRFGLKLHRILGPDWARDIHDHPWTFYSIVLWGSYIEVLEDGSERRIRWFNRKRAREAHRILEVAPHTWTLVLTLRKSRDWGFVTERGWVQWERYLEAGGWQAARMQ